MNDIDWKAIAERHITGIVKLSYQRDQQQARIEALETEVESGRKLRSALREFLGIEETY